MLDLIKKELIEASTLLNKIIDDDDISNKINDIATIMIAALNNNKKIVSFGNGGSHCDAMHFAEELTGRYRNDRKPFAALAISDTSHISCVSNDYGFDYIFSRFIEGVCNEGDIAFGISTSGNSNNVIEAFKIAKNKNMTTILLTGKDGGNCINYADYSIVVPHYGYADRIQEIHIKIIHILIMLIENGNV